MPKGTSSRKHIYYVYALLDPRKPGYFRYGRWVFHNEPFYIGKGKGNRVDFHLFECSLKTKSHKNNKLKKILSEGLQPVVTFKKSKLTEKQALKLEVSLIARIGRSNLKTGPLTNLTDGGEGTSGKITTEEAKAKLSAIAKARPPEYWLEQRKYRNPVPSEKEKKMWENFGKLHLGVKQSPEFIAKRVAARKGYKHSEETKQKMRDSRVGYRQTDEAKAKIRAANLGLKMSEATKQKIRDTIARKKAER